MSNAQNGARIKAWAGKGVGSGLVKNITFDGFVQSNVDNPVIIDQVRNPLSAYPHLRLTIDIQCYETSDSDCEEYPSNVYIQDIYFKKLTCPISTLAGY
jgi:galacturan 1,4-alpha-galacturonidase